MLTLTATPHSGDSDRFTRFLALLDPDQFSSPDLVKRQIALPDNPFLSPTERRRRLAELRVIEASDEETGTDDADEAAEEAAATEVAT